MSLTQVTTALLADASITSAKLASGAAASNLANGSITAIKLATGAAVSNIGASGITSNELAASAVTPAKLSQPLTAGTPVATTSGTSVTFGSIPSWVKRITVMLNGVSLSGSANVRFRLGPTGGLATSGYTGYTNILQNTTAIATLSAGFDASGASTTATTYSGLVTFACLDATNNIWVTSGLLSETSSAAQTAFSGAVTLSGTLTQVGITSTNGTDTFDAGSVNIIYE